MPVSFPGVARDHEIPKPTRRGLMALSGLLLLLALTGCVSKKTHRKAVEEAYARGADEVEQNMRPYVINLERTLEAERFKNASRQPRDEKGRFTRVNGIEVDRDGK